MNIAPYFNAALLATKQAAVSGYGKISTLCSGNPNAAVSYIQIFDAASTDAVTVGTTTPTAVVPLPASTPVNVVLSMPFRNGIVVAATTTPTGSTAPVTAGLPVTLIFQ